MLISVPTEFVDGESVVRFLQVISRDVDERSRATIFGQVVDEDLGLLNDFLKCCRRCFA